MQRTGNLRVAKTAVTTDQIHAEWTRNVIKNRPELEAAKLQRTCELMNANVRDSLVVGYEAYIDSIELPDASDRHVVAAAAHSRAEVIVTFNLKDFPKEALSQFNIEAIHPDDFITDLWDLNAAKVLEAARDHRLSLKNPPKDQDGYLETLLKQGLPNTVALLSEIKIAF
jgi:hypothetical protein